MFINRSPWRLIDKYYVMINYVMVLLGNKVHTTMRNVYWSNERLVISTIYSNIMTSNDPAT